MEIKAKNLKEGYNLLEVSETIKPLKGDIILIRAFGTDENNKDVEIWEVKSIQSYIYAINSYHSTVNILFALYLEDDGTPAYAPLDTYYPLKKPFAAYIVTNYKSYAKTAKLFGEEIKDFKTFIKDITELSHACPAYWTDNK